MKRHWMIAAALLCAAAASSAAVKIEGAWARPSVQGQKTSGAYMKLTADADTTLVGVSSPAAGAAEVHEMKMDGDVMRMRSVEGVRLPAGKAVELKPGGFHVMLMELKAPLMKDSSVPLTLVFRDAKGKETRQEVLVPVRTSSASEHKH
jgi:copper(I)-binding protein